MVDHAVSCKLRFAGAEKAAAHRFEGRCTPFFCQVEAVETIIWLTEVARGRRQYANIWTQLEAANAEANPELFRHVMKMATGLGKTTVMAMLMAWHTVNAVRSPNSSLFSRGFLIVTPGITIRDRLRVLLPSDPENYYATRHLMPQEMLLEMAKAKIVITNFHALGRRRVLDTNKTGEAILSGWRNEELITEETEGEMLQRACEELLTMKNIVVMNDEAHHCYREKVGSGEEEKLTAEDRQEAKENNELHAYGFQASKLSNVKWVCVLFMISRPRPSFCAAPAMKRAHRTSSC